LHQNKANSKKHAMKRSLTRLAGASLMALAFLATSCKAPKYIEYKSARADIQMEVPWGWNVYVDTQGDDFFQYNFVGHFDPAFFLGVPSMNVRWYRFNALHRLRDGTLEMYASSDDFIEQTLGRIYAPEYRLRPHPKTGKKFRTVKVSGWAATNFIVESIVRVPDSYTYGVAIEPGTDDTAVLRHHAYVVVPMDNGVYVLNYPATRDGYPKHLKKFNHLVNTFRALTDGPGGEKL
jgi:hypothetical protein